METVKSDNATSIKLLENSIDTIIQKDNINNTTVTFIYEPGTEKVIDLYIITSNPIHANEFLFYHTWGLTKIEALEKALIYVSKMSHTEYTYTVEWKEKDSKVVTSYFSGCDMFEVLKKFYHGKNPDKYFIFSIHTNPIA